MAHKENKRLDELNTQLAQAVRLERESKESQIAVLELVAKKDAESSKQLSDQLIKLEGSNEIVTCSMPVFMRDAFNGM